MSTADRRAAVAAWFATPRFERTMRLHTASDVIDQQGTIPADHAVAREAAVAFHERLRERFAGGRSITTFGPYSPGQAVVQKRLGLEAIYLGGWATSAKGSAHEDPGPDLASYPLSAVPDEAAAIVRALLAADRNQAFARARMTAEARAANPAADFRPFIIADADTGHGGDAHVRNVIRRFVEVGVPGYHLEDQRPGAKKCGHQDGKVLVSQVEQLKRLNAARFQLDVMGVPGLIVARTDAEAAQLIDDISDERDQPFVLGATVRDLPPFRAVAIVVQVRLHELGLSEVRGHQLYALGADDQARASAWLRTTGLDDDLRQLISAERERAARTGGTPAAATVLDQADERVTARWAEAARLTTRDEAGAGPWDPALARTADGFHRVRGSVAMASARSIAAAPFADLLWMETKTPDLADARAFAETVHAAHPEAMLAYNLSPSFNWDASGLDDEAMRRFPDELGALGFVFTFITYGGHQLDGLATDEFCTDLQRDGMLALARLQRRLRLVDSPYRTPQALVGGAREDAALMAATGRTAATRAMGAASTHHQHLVPIERPPSTLADDLADWASDRAVAAPVQVSLRPLAAGSDRLRLTVTDRHGGPLATLDSVVVEGSSGPVLLLTRWASHMGGDDTADLRTRMVEYLAARGRAIAVTDLAAPLADQPSERIPVA
jgi:isocitrate lyase